MQAMAMTHNAFIDGDQFAQKLLIEGMGGGTWFGTGFVLDQCGRRWLMTCWHVLEPHKSNFAGIVDAKTITFVNPQGPSIDLQNGRAIVGIRLNGIQVDCAAIELGAGESPSGPRFDADLQMNHEGFPQYAEISIHGKGGGDGILLPVLAHYMAQGFPGTDVDAKAVTMHCVTVEGLPKAHPSMIAYYPAGGQGFSGGPLIRVDGTTGNLAGIHVHTYNAMLQLNGRNDRTQEPMTVDVGSASGGAAPIQPLIDAMGQVQAGTQIIDLPL